MSDAFLFIDESGAFLDAPQEGLGIVGGVLVLAADGDKVMEEVLRALVTGASHCPQPFHSADFGLFRNCLKRPPNTKSEKHAVERLSPKWELVKQTRALEKPGAWLQDLRQDATVEIQTRCHMGRARVVVILAGCDLATADADERGVAYRDGLATVVRLVGRLIKRNVAEPSARTLAIRIEEFGIGSTEQVRICVDNAPSCIRLDPQPKVDRKDQSHPGVQLADLFVHWAARGPGLRDRLSRGCARLAEAHACNEFRPWTLLTDYFEIASAHDS